MLIVLQNFLAHELAREPRSWVAKRDWSCYRETGLAKVEELTAMKEVVEQVAAAQPWANHRNWMGKAIERAIAAKAGRL